MTYVLPFSDISFSQSSHPTRLHFPSTQEHHATMTGLNVVALISGGKDSLFSILHCHANGHKIVALANLHPPNGPDRDEMADMDSFMYQTIGHAVIPLYSEALGLPLYRRPIDGGAVNQAKVYDHDLVGTTSCHDETESLVPLLRSVISAHPEVNAVSTGAILSDYQRTRVESVAIRLGLIPLSYLWQWPSLPPASQTSLLEDMAAVGQDSRIIKVASGGLDESFLWQDVGSKSTMQRLLRAAERFGTAQDGAVLGEGGEYETLAISGPPPLWKGRICVPADGISVVPGEAGSASIKLRDAYVEHVKRDGQEANNLRRPSLFDHQFQSIRDAVQAGNPSSPSSPTVRPPFTQERQTVPNSPEHTLVLSDLTGDGETVAEQTRSTMDSMIQKLHAAGHDASNVLYTTVILRDMADFATFNGVYGSYFTHPNPPARLTVACAKMLPSHARVMIGCSSALGTKEGLHVQSRSYWAPANIGPYSQASSLLAEHDSAQPDHVYIAGQIPLVPATMELVVASTGDIRDCLAYQTVLSLQHLCRIGVTMKVVEWTAAIAFVAAPADSHYDAMTLASMALHAWKALHDEVPPSTDEHDAEDVDIWDLTHGSGRAAWQAGVSRETSARSQVIPSGRVPPLYVIQVDSLPRNSSIEWVGSGCKTPEHRNLPLQLQRLLLTFQPYIVLDHHDSCSRDPS